MKKLLFGLLVAGTLGFSSCKKDEPTNSTPSNPILGTWEMTDYRINLKDSLTNGSLVDTTIVETYAAGALTIEFLNNGTVINTEIDGGQVYKDTGYYSFNSPTLKMWESGETEADASLFNVTFSGSNVSLKSPEEYFTFDVGGLPLAMKSSMTINGKRK